MFDSTDIGRNNILSGFLYTGILLFVIFPFSSYGQQPVTEPSINITLFKQERNLPELNQAVIDTMLRYGPQIAPTYRKAVCTELVIRILEKFHQLNRIDKSRIRIITNGNIQSLLIENSPIPKGVYYALTTKGIGEAVDDIKKVIPGDFVQFWTESWGHCGVVKEINIENSEMTLYSSFPSTNGYGEQKFSIPEYVFFVRLK